MTEKSFDNCNIGNAILYVPAASIDKYKAADQWKEFGTIKAISATTPTHTLTYKVDGEVYKEYSIEEGTAITPEPAPTKTGYTFSGWSEIPATMPDHDVEVNGSFTVNQYTITFDTDGGSAISPITQDYGTPITAPGNPTKTGYTFAGWDKDIPATMPAENVTIKAKWTINSYKLTYKVGDVVYKETTVDFGSAITPETAPEKEGYTFNGWSEIPSTMPDHDVVITGSFTVNQYTVKFVADGVTIKEDKLDFGAAIVAPENPTKDGYEFKGWNPEVDSTVPSHDVTYTAVFEAATGINGIVLDAEYVDVRNINGQLVKKSATMSDIHWLPAGIYIINGKKIVKK